MARREKRGYAADHIECLTTQITSIVSSFFEQYSYCHFLFYENLKPAWGTCKCTTRMNLGQPKLIKLLKNYFQNSSFFQKFVKKHCFQTLFILPCISCYRNTSSHLSSNLAWRWFPTRFQYFNLFVSKEVFFYLPYNWKFPHLRYALIPSKQPLKASC